MGIFFNPKIIATSSLPPLNGSTVKAAEHPSLIMLLAPVLELVLDEQESFDVASKSCG